MQFKTCQTIRNANKSFLERLEKLFCSGHAIYGQDDHICRKNNEIYNKPEQNQCRTSLNFQDETN